MAAKQDLETLRGAFDELSDRHERILVMRELEGLSYREIGERMQLTRPGRGEHPVPRPPPARRPSSPSWTPAAAA